MCQKGYPFSATIENIIKLMLTLVNIIREHYKTVNLLYKTKEVK